MAILTVHAQEVTLKEKINSYADKWDIDRKLFRDVIDCESGASTTIQSGYFDKNGKQEESWGIAQINLIYWPTITKEQTFDPDFSLNFLGRWITAGHGSWWTCYNKKRKL